MVTDDAAVRELTSQEGDPELGHVVAWLLSAGQVLDDKYSSALREQSLESIYLSEAAQAVRRALVVLDSDTGSSRGRPEIVLPS